MIGPVADSRNPFIMDLQVIHSVPVKVSGNADPCVIKKQPVYNPGNLLMYKEKMKSNLRGRW